MKPWNLGVSAILREESTLLQVRMDSRFRLGNGSGAPTNLGAFPAAGEPRRNRLAFATLLPPRVRAGAAAASLQSGLTFDTPFTNTSLHSVHKGELSAPETASSIAFAAPIEESLPTP